MTGSGQRAWRTRVAAIGFPVVLWFVATFFLLGDLGLLSDDWCYVQRVPETGAVRSLVLDHPLHFWRPLYRVIVPTIETLFWRHEWAGHLIAALAHALNAWLLWRLLASLGTRRMAAAICALAFMVSPWHFEVVFWICNLPTSLSTSVMLGALLVMARWARGKGGWWIVLFAAGTTFVGACLNEQPSMMIGASPCVVLCAASGPARRLRLLQAFAAAGAGAVVMVVYTKLHLLFVSQKLDIGGAHGFLPLSEWPDSAGRTWTWFRDFATSGDWLSRAWMCGVSMLVEFPIRSIGMGTAAAALGAVWVRQMACRGHEPCLASLEMKARPIALAILGIVIIALALLPIVIFDYWRMPRVFYAPAIGAAVVLASMFSAAASWSRRPLEKLLWPRAIIACLAGVALVVESILMIGVQEGYRRRSRLDHQALAELAAIAPDPDPGAVLVPARVEFPAMEPSAARFEGYYWSVFGSWWSSGFAIPLAYKRSDLRAGCANWGQSAWAQPSSESVFVSRVGRVPWARVVAFTYDPTGHVHLVTHVRFRENGQVREVELPQATRFVERTLAAPSTFTFPGS